MDGRILEDGGVDDSGTMEMKGENSSLEGWRGEDNGGKNSRVVWREG